MVVTTEHAPLALFSVLARGLIVLFVYAGSSPKALRVEAAGCSILAIIIKVIQKDKPTQSQKDVCNCRVFRILLVRRASDAFFGRSKEVAGRDN